MAGKIFISYRRSGSPKDALLVYKHLAAEFGADAVFMDVSGIRPGDDFVEVLEQQLADCTVLLALIGPDWLGARNEYGERKLDDEDDFVRVEIRTALQRRMRVVPLLLDGAPMPRRVDLPEDLHPMVRRQGLPVDATNLHNFRAAMGRLEEVLREALSAPALSAAVPPVAASRAAWMSAEGRDDYGRWAELRVHGVVQRLRWIEPGEFWMGSPKDEPERYDDEVRHRVRLTKGFWLADTACTQALWEAVLFHNPSNFTGDLQRPVEQVGWNDVTQQFLPALNRKLPGLDGRLPTEAEWEYACRAGTTTPFFWSEPITTQKLNYDGNWPYNGAPRGLYREKTVPVKEFHPNAWGLYQMHGNVWEWCQDVTADYPTTEVVDPIGPQDGVDGCLRVLRGGSWRDVGGHCRSAYRRADEPVGRYQSIGFRLARGVD